MNVQNNNIRIAVQKKGRLQEESLEFLKTIGIEAEKDDSKLIRPCKNSNVEILFVRNSDIPEYVKSGVADYGILGENVLIEKKQSKTLKIIKRLGFGKCKLVIAAPKNSKIKCVNDLSEERIATSYTNTLKTYLKKKRINASMIEINGSVEICPSLDLSDAICDITQTGNTLRENGLEIIETIMESEAVLIQSPFIKEILTQFR